MKLAKRLDNVSEYVFSKYNKIIKEIEQSSGKKVLNFGIGSPDFPPSKTYVKKLQEYIAEKDTYIYPGYSAQPEFSDALIGWYKKRFGVHLEKNELLILLGGKEGASHLPVAILNEGEEVLVPDPGYPGFAGPTELFGGIVVGYHVTKENNFTIDLKEIAKKISSKTKYMWVNYPSNPTGQVATLEDLKPIVTFAKKHNIIIIYDNAYAEIAFDGFVPPSILQIPEAKDIAIELGSFSKSHSFAGLRMGWFVGNKEIIAAVAKVKSQIDSGMTAALQKLGTYALMHEDKKWKKEMIESYKNRRDIIAKKITKLGLQFVMPKGALYIWAEIPKNAKNSEEYCMQLLKEKNIFVAPGIAFGQNGDRYVRISICVNIDTIDDYL